MNVIDISNEEFKPRIQTRESDIIDLLTDSDDVCCGGARLSVHVIA